MTEGSPRLRDYLTHLQEAIERIEHDIADIDEIKFLRDPLVQDAVLRNIEVIGEAANWINKRHPDYADQYPSIPWQVIYAMRNRISHAYHKVDLEVVWKTIEIDLPKIYKEVSRMLSDSMRALPADPDDAPELDHSFFERADEWEGNRLIRRGRRTESD